MEDDVKFRFEDLEKRLQTTDKRFDDVKWVFASTSAFLGIVITVLAIYTGKQSDLINAQTKTLNEELSSQNKTFAQFASELKAELRFAFDHSENGVQRQLDLQKASSQQFSSFLNQRYDDRAGELRGLESRVNDALKQTAEPAQLEMLGHDYEALEGQILPATLATDKDGDTLLKFYYLLRNTGKSMSGDMILKVYSKESLFDGISDDPQFSSEKSIFNDHITNSNLPGGNYTTPQTVELSVRKDTHPGKHTVVLRAYYGGFREVHARFVLDAK